MQHTERLVLVHRSGDTLYPIMMENKTTGKVSFRLVPYGGDKTTDLYETEDVEEALDLILNKNYSVRCSTLTQTVKQKDGISRKRQGLYSINGASIVNYRVR